MYKLFIIFCFPLTLLTHQIDYITLEDGLSAPYVNLEKYLAENSCINPFFNIDFADPDVEKKILKNKSYINLPSLANLRLSSSYSPSPLHVFSYRTYPPAINLLLNHGANPNLLSISPYFFLHPYPDETMRTPLGEICCFGGNGPNKAEGLRILLAAGAHPDIGELLENREGGFINISPLALALYYQIAQVKECIPVLLAYNANKEKALEGIDYLRQREQYPFVSSYQNSLLQQLRDDDFKDDEKKEKELKKLKELKRLTKGHNIVTALRWKKRGIKFSQKK